MQSPELVPRLCRILQEETVDSVARQNALGALQKLSLRRAPQNSMIDHDVIAWLVSAASASRAHVAGVPSRLSRGAGWVS